MLNRRDLRVWRKVCSPEENVLNGVRNQMRPDTKSNRSRRRRPATTSAKPAALFLQ
jgi:hypothetical protein